MQEKIPYYDYYSLYKFVNQNSTMKSFFIFDDISTFVTDFQFATIIHYPIRLGLVVAFICKKGFAKVQIEMKTYTVEQDMVLVILAEQIFEFIEFSPDFEASCILLESKFFDVQNDFKIALNLERHFFKQPCVYLPQKEREEVITIFNLIKNKIEEKNNLFLEEIVQTYIRVLFYLTSHFLIKSHDRTIKTRKEEIFETFITLLQKNFHQKRAVSWYAEKVFLTSKYFSTVIYEISGKHASDWIKDYVILEAKALLNSSSLTIQQISDKLNFSNPSHFGSYFKRFTGTSPRGYRNGEQLKNT
ncbi:MAG: helix-turn-helix domain-containing protein [Bacteroidales bacterium]|nr:helix-turn-helix domain-containing protein [Bacteroidales bacterium]